MGSHGIRDRVCIVGMGCIPFGEHWDLSTEDMLMSGAALRRAPRPSIAGRPGPTKIASSV